MPGGRGSIGRRCGCKDPVTGRQFGNACPGLKRSSKHGEFYFEIRIHTSKGRRKLHRSGYPAKKDAQAVIDRIGELVRLAGRRRRDPRPDRRPDLVGEHAARRAASRGRGRAPPPVARRRPRG